MLRRNVLIFHLGALGDFVLTWPLALALGRLFPQSRVSYVTHGQKAALAERVLRIEAADIELGWHRLFSDAQLPDGAVKTLAGAHTIVSFIAAPGSVWEQNVRRLAPSANLLLMARPSGETARHVSEHLIEQLQPHPAIQTATRQILSSIHQRGVGASSAAGEAILLHPGAGSRTKCWPIGKFVELASRLRRGGKTVAFLIGEVEHEHFSPDELAALRDAADVHAPSDLLELHNHLANASLVVGHDTGPSHLSAIIGRPTVALFGPTDPAVWQPLGPRVKVLRHEPLELLSVDCVMEVIERSHKMGHRWTQMT